MVGERGEQCDDGHDGRVKKGEKEEVQHPVSKNHCQDQSLLRASKASAYSDSLVPTSSDPFAPNHSSEFGKCLPRLSFRHSNHPPRVLVASALCLTAQPSLEPWIMDEHYCRSRATRRAATWQSTCSASHFNMGIHICKPEDEKILVYS